jgi:sulfopyruvate decarboxylase TPP-binding subunit
MIIGKLAAEIGYNIELNVLKSNRGYYIGTMHEYMPMSRESEEYFSSADLAKQALAESTWTQRLHP